MKKLFIPLMFMFAFGFGRAVYCFDFSDVKLTPKVSVSQKYDDNITFASDNKKSDFITTIALGLGLDYQTKLQSLSLSGKLDVNQQLFMKENEFNNLSQSFTLNYTKEFSPYTRISFTNSFDHKEEPRSFEDEFGRTDGRYSYCLNTAGFTLTKDFSKQLTCRLNYSNQIYKVNRADLSDSYLNKIGVSADYYLSSATILLSSYDFSYREFDPGDSSYTNSLSGGVRRYLTPKLYVDGRVGVDSISGYNDKTFTESFFSSSLTGDLDEVTQAKLSFLRQSSTNAYTQDVFNNWRFSGSFNRQLSNKVKFLLTAFYGKGKYDSSSVEDTNLGISAGLDYDLSENLTGFVRYGYSEKNSTNKTNEYKKNTISIGISRFF